MEQLNEQLISRIETALNITLKEWQVNYILSRPMILDMKDTGRLSGKTLAYIIKLLFESDEPLSAYNIDNVATISDWWSVDTVCRPNSPYTQWFRRFLMDVYECLNNNHISTRLVFCSKDEIETYCTELARQHQNENLIKIKTIMRNGNYTNFEKAEEVLNSNINNVKSFVIEIDHNIIEEESK